MRFGDMVFIFIILLVGVCGGILMIATSTDPTQTQDSFGNSMNTQTNDTKEMIQDVAVADTNYGGAALVAVAGITVVLLVLGIMVVLRKSHPGMNKYRT